MEELIFWIFLIREVGDVKGNIYEKFFELLYVKLVKERERFAKYLFSEL